ncbi:RNA polymerase sigma factor SigJ [Fulvivirgaceae bacterium BMA10]|uniref:RNA polymerase sigma factor SigJ n=1 Tax=Splendidivirga corallicola TaxID=3051826 RepID=A0ABT8KM78_9BACT|nr:RNA polymerase sigma factor SigJ [Fulvivirgaceae bacterium BMA10]
MIESKRELGNKMVEFECHRNLIFSIAYQMLGSVQDAEDIVQDCFIKWAKQNQKVHQPKAYLATIATRLCIDFLRVKSKRSDYIGPWLPEPILDHESDLIDQEGEKKDPLPMAIMLLLEKLNPYERAVFVLRESFKYPYSEIALFLERSEENCRQLLTRARKALNRLDDRSTIGIKERKVFVQQFMKAIADQNIEQLKKLLAKDIAYHADGGGKVRGAALNVIYGVEHVAKFIIGVFDKITPSDQHIELHHINGELNILIRHQSQPRLIICLDVGITCIENIFVIGNPEKLRHIKNQ